MLPQKQVKPEVDEIVVKIQSRVLGIVATPLET